MISKTPELKFRPHIDLLHDQRPVVSQSQVVRELHPDRRDPVDVDHVDGDDVVGDGLAGNSRLSRVLALCAPHQDVQVVLGFVHAERFLRSLLSDGLGQRLDLLEPDYHRPAKVVLSLLDLPIRDHISSSNH